MDIALKFQPLVALFFAFGFIVIYSIYGRWWVTSIGRHMVGFMAGCSVVLLIGVVVRFFPELDGIKQVRFWSWNIVIALFAWRFIVALQVWVFKNQSDLKHIRDVEDSDLKRVRTGEDREIQRIRDVEDAQ